MGKIIDFVDILSKPERITQIIRDELEEIKTNYGDERRSEINPFGGDIADEDLIPQREMVVTLTHGGYIKPSRPPTIRLSVAAGAANRRLPPKTKTLSKPCLLPTRMTI